MNNTFSVKGGTPIVNGVPIRRVTDCKIESVNCLTTVTLKFDVPSNFRLIQREAVTFDFGFALEALKQGQKITRQSWNGKNMWLRLIIPETADIDMGYDYLPYIEIKTADNKLVPWLASQTDMLAEDWMVVQE